MIAKISPPSKDLMKTLTYNFRKVDRDQADILLSGQLSADGRLTAERVFREMTAYIPSGARTKNIVFHASINSRPDEPLSDDRLRTIAREYLCRLGYGDQPFIVFKHRDIAREHIHLVSTRVRHDGSKIRDTMEHVRSTRIMRSLEAKFGLLPSSPSRKKEDVSAQPSAVDIDAGDIKRQVAAAVEHVLGRYAFQSVGEMNLLLARFRVTAEEVKTERKGRPFDGIVYAATDADGHKICTPIKASEIGREFGFRSLPKQFDTGNTLKPIIPSGHSPTRSTNDSTPIAQVTGSVLDAAENLLSEVGEVTTLQTHGADYAEIAWQRRLRNQAVKKKKRGRGI